MRGFVLTRILLGLDSLACLLVQAVVVSQIGFVLPDAVQFTSSWICSICVLNVHVYVTATKSYNLNIIAVGGLFVLGELSSAHRKARRIL